MPLYKRGITTPVSVANGGTGVATLGDAGVLIGNGTGAVQVTGAGTSGQVLTSNGAGVDPTFQAAGGGATAVTLIPHSNISPISSVEQKNMASNTTLYVGQIIIPFSITVNKISIRSGAAPGVGATANIAIFSEDGQTRHISVVTASLDAAATIYTTTVSSVALSAGIYYIAFNINGSGADIQTYYWGGDAIPFSNTAGLSGDITSEPRMQGTLTITASTMPSTIDPTAIVEGVTDTLIARLDN